LAFAMKVVASLGPSVLGGDFFSRGKETDFAALRGTSPQPSASLSAALSTDRM